MTQLLDDVVKMIAHNVNPNLKYFSIPCYDCKSFSKVCNSYNQRYSTTLNIVDKSFNNLTVLNFKQDKVIIRNIVALTYFDNIMKRDTITIILLLAEI